MIEKIAHVTTALKDSPGLLAIVLLQFTTMAMVYFVSSSNAAHMHEREMALIAACQPKEQ